MTSMKEILADIVRAIVDHPDDVVVSEVESKGEVNLVLSVHADDMGMVIGRHGRIAKAIRSEKYCIQTSWGLSLLPSMAQAIV